VDIANILNQHARFDVRSNGPNVDKTGRQTVELTSNNAEKTAYRSINGRETGEEETGTGLFTKSRIK